MIAAHDIDLLSRFSFVAAWKKKFPVSFFWQLLNICQKHLEQHSRFKSSGSTLGTIAWSAQLFTLPQRVSCTCRRSNGFPAPMSPWGIKNSNNKPDFLWQCQCWVASTGSKVPICFCHLSAAAVPSLSTYPAPRQANIIPLTDRPRRFRCTPVYFLDKPPRLRCQYYTARKPLSTMDA